MAARAPTQALPNGQGREALHPEPAARDCMPTRFALHHRVLPLRVDGSTLLLAIEEGYDVETLDEVALRTGLRIEPREVPARELEEALRLAYGVGAGAVAGQELPEGDAGPRAAVTDLEAQTEDAAVIRVVNEILRDALSRRATDVHLEPYRDRLRLRYRIDGILYETAVPQELHRHRSAVVSRIKILASLDIAEHRLPQDGRIKVRVGGEELDLRISTLPTPFGEAVQIRLLSSQTALLDLGQLGLLPRQRERLEAILQRPHGVVLVTGPTGSGKTTTLYACLQRLNTADRKIITIEDPIEYQLDGITQIQVHPQIGLTFARGLRSMLRHDPDIMMVGEIRDQETAEVAVQVAMTGHLVFSTVHTNDAASTATRLMDMGIEPYLIASSVECFIAQRLVRLVCRVCATSRAPSAAEQAMLSTPGPRPTAVPVAVGCESCNATGYRGRTAIYELLPLDETIQSLILTRAPSRELLAAARRSGMRPLFEDGVEKIALGLTTLEEVCRVTQATEPLAAPHPDPR